MYTLLALWVVVNIFSLFLIFVTLADGSNFSFVNPIVIHKNIRVNWLGAWLLAIALNICLPIVSIPYWIYKACTVGRV